VQLVTETAQVELKCGRVQAPGAGLTTDPLHHVHAVPQQQGLTLVHFAAQREHVLWDMLGA